MNRNSRTGSRLFFIEFLIVLFFFLIISTVCLRLFVKSHTITQHSEALSHAQAIAASVASVIEQGAITPTEAASFFPDASVTSDGFFITYDNDFVPCSAESASYALTVVMTQQDHTLRADIQIENKKHELIYQLPVSFHLALTRKEALQ